MPSVPIYRGTNRIKSTKSSRMVVMTTSSTGGSLAEKQTEITARVLRRSVIVPPPGSLSVDDTRQKESLTEASAVVHRKLGTSKRYSETEKRDIAEVLAGGLFELRARWNDQADQTKQQLEHDEIIHESKRKSWTSLICETQTFARAHIRQLDNNAHDLMTTTDLFTRLASATQTDSSLFVDALQSLVERVTRTFSHHEALVYEREKCLRLLEEEHGPTLTLDKLLARRGKFYQLSGWMDRVEDKDRLIRALTVQFEELTVEVEEFREEVDWMRQGLEDIEEELRQWDQQGVTAAET